MLSWLSWWAVAVTRVRVGNTPLSGTEIRIWTIILVWTYILQVVWVCTDQCWLMTIHDRYCGDFAIKQMKTWIFMRLMEIAIGYSLTPLVEWLAPVDITDTFSKEAPRLINRMIDCNITLTHTRQWGWSNFNRSVIMWVLSFDWFYWLILLIRGLRALFVPSLPYLGEMVSFSCLPSF